MLYAKIPNHQYNLALENHMYGMPPIMYDKYPILSQWYTIVSTTLDRNGTEYVSSMEGKKMPFFGTKPKRSVHEDQVHQKLMSHCSFLLQEPNGTPRSLPMSSASQRCPTPSTPSR